MHKCPKSTCFVSCHLDWEVVISKLAVYIVCVLLYLVVLSWCKGGGGMVL